MSSSISNIGGSSPASIVSQPNDLALFEADLEQDTINTAEGAITKNGANYFILPQGNITISEFSNAVLISLDTTNSTIRSSQTAQLEADAVSSQARYIASYLLALQNSMIQAAQDTITLTNSVNNDISNQNNIINNFNSVYPPADQAADASSIDQLNQMITEYNNGQLSAADLTTYINTTYDPYQTDRNATLSSIVTSNNSSIPTYETQLALDNQSIATLNQERINADLPGDVPTLTETPVSAALLPDAPSQPYSTPLALLPDPPVVTTLDTLPAPMSVGQTLETYFTPIVNAIMAQFALADKSVNLLQANTDFFITTNQGKKPNLPNMLISSAPKIFFESQGNGAGGVALASMVSNLGDPHINGTIQEGIVKSNLTNFQILATSPNLINYPFLFAQLAGTAGLQAANAAIRQLETTGLAATDPDKVFNVLFATSFTQIVNALVASGNVKATVEEFVQQQLQGQADQATIDRTTELLTADVNKSLLQTALVTAAQTLQLPGLISQFLSNVNGVQPADLQAQQRTIDQTISQLTVQVFLKSIVSEQIVSSGTAGKEQAAVIANAAINAALAQGSIASTADLENRISDALIQQGVAQDQAQTLATLAASIVKQEQSAVPLIGSALLSAGPTKDELAAQLAAQGYEQAAAQRLAEIAVQQLLGSAFLTNATEYTIVLQRQLESLGVTPAASLLASSSTVANLNQVPAGTSPLLNPLPPSQFTPLDQLLSDLHGFIVGAALPTSGPDRAREIADEAITAIFTGAPGTPSLLELFNEVQQRFEDLGGTYGKELVIDGYQLLSTPPPDVLAFSLDITNLAHIFMHSFREGVMYSGVGKPSNFKKELDISV